MIEEIRLPEISENVDTGDVINVLVKVDDYIEKDQSVVELETEKAAFEVPSPFKGRVSEISVKEGDSVKVGQVILKVDTEAEKKEEKPKEAGQKPPEEEKGREEEKGKKEPSDKQQPPEKKLQEPQEEPEKRIEETEKQKDIPSEPEATKQTEKPKEKPEAGKAVPAAPSVRQLARELGIDIHKVTGTDKTGRITADDVKEYARNIIKGGTAKPAEIKAKPLPDFTKWGEIERKKITTTRKKIAATLTYTWSNVPQVTQYDQADITSLEESRKQYSSKSEKDGTKLTITSITLKVAALALKEFPKFNSSFNPENNEIIYKKYFHISVAVETDRGLLVPVIRDVDKKNIVQLSAELSDLAQKTREHKVRPEEMVGGNFTISNLGGIGGTNFAPIIYWPQVAILGIARAARQPVYKEGRIEPRLILPLSISYDHRIIDGAEGLIFLRWIVKHLENPLLLAMEEQI